MPGWDTCLRTKTLLVFTSTISLQNKAKNVLRMRFKQYNDNTIIHYNVRALCAISRKIALKGLFFLIQSKSVSRVKKHSGNDFCSLLPGNCNALPRIWRPKLAEHLSEHENRHNRHRLFRNFLRLLRAIEWKMATLLVYLSLLYVEKKQRYKHLNQAEHSKCNSKIGNASFA
jgi:hypothetical protein